MLPKNCRKCKKKNPCSWWKCFDIWSTCLESTNWYNIYEGTNTILLRGTKSREALRHFGKAPGTKGSHTKPYTRTRHSEIARGRWKYSLILNLNFSLNIFDIIRLNLI